MVQFRVDVVVDPRQAVAGGKKVEKKLRTMKNRANELRSAMARAVAVFGGFLVARKVLRVLASFEQSMANIQAVTNSTDEQMKLFSVTAQNLGRTTKFTATQAADSLVLLSRAGFTLQESTAAVEGTLRLAQAAGIDLATATDITASSLRGFRLAATQTGEVVDVLALASSRANTTVTQLGIGMKFVAPIAAGLGVSLQTTASAMGVLSDSGLQASMAGTGLRRVLAELESPGNKTVQILTEMGISADEIQVSSVGLTAALERLSAAGIDTGRALEIFGQRGGPAFEVLVSNIPKLRRLNAELDKAGGTATRMAKTMDDTLKGAALRLISAISGLILNLNEVGGIAFGLTKTLNKLAEAFNAVSEATGAGMREAAAEAAAGLNTVGLQIQRFQKEIKLLETIVEKRGFASPAQQARLKQLDAQLTALRGGYKKTAQTAIEAGNAADEEAKKRALSAAVAKDAVEKAADPFAAQVRSLEQANELIRIEIELGEEAAQAKEIEFGLQEEGVELDKTRIANIRELVELQAALNSDLEEQRGILQDIEDDFKKAERDRAREERQVESLARRINLTDRLTEANELLLKAKERNLITDQQLVAEQEKLRLRGLEASTSLEAGFERAFIKIGQEAENLAAIGEQVVNVFADRAVDALLELSNAGQLSFKELANAILEDLKRILARLLVVQALNAAFGGGAAASQSSAALFSGIGLAEGGTMQPGRSFLVGENGPEIVQSDKTASVTPIASAAPTAAPEITIVNSFDPTMVPDGIMSVAGRQAILNVVGTNAKKIRRMLQ